MRIIASKKINCNVSGLFSQLEYQFTVEGEEEEVKMKLDELTSDAYSKYASEASRMRAMYEETDTQFGEESARLREENDNLRKRIALGQLIIKTANKMKVMDKEQYEAVVNAVKESAEYRKMMGIPTEDTE